MIGKKMEKALNAQLNAEYYSSYMYLSMAAYFESIDLPGFANWMRVQTQEEEFHALKFFDYLVERAGRVALQAIDAPPTEWSSPLNAFEETLKHEQKVTALINDLLFLARDERDNAAEIFLQWYVTEQVEEEDSVNKILMLDKELSQRSFTPPASE